MSFQQSASDRWIVLLIAENDDKTVTYRLPSSTPVGSIRARWSEEHGVSVGSTVLRLVDGTVIADEKSLLDVGEGQQGSRTVNLWVEEQAQVYLRLHHTPDTDPLPMVVSLCQRPEELHPEVQHIFNLSERPFRLLSPESSPLLYDESLGQQGVLPDSVLHVDLAFLTTVKEAWDGHKEQRLLYTSEAISELVTEAVSELEMEEPSGHPERIMLGRRQLDLAKELASLPGIYLKQSTLSAQHESQRCVATLFGDRLRSRCVWPNDTARRLIKKVPPSSEVLFEGRPVTRKDEMKRLGVQEGSVFTRTTRVLVVLSNGKSYFIPVTDCANVADLHEAVVKREKDDNFLLSCGGRLLEGHEKVAALKDGVRVERADTVLVSLFDRSVRWNPKRPSLTPSEFLCELAEKGRERFDLLTARTLVCAGCGRTISVQEDDFQRLPAPCCSVRSMRLREILHPEFVEIGTQAECWIPRNAEEAIEEEVSDDEDIVDAATLRPLPPVVEGMEDKDEGAKLSFPFRLQCTFQTHYGYTFPADLELAEGATGADVKKALGEFLERPTDDLRLSRAITKALYVYRVCDDGRPEWEGFGDPKGLVERGLEEMGEETFTTEVVDDDSVFLTVPNRRNCVTVESMRLRVASESEDEYYDVEYEQIYKTMNVDGVPTKKKWWSRVQKSATGFQKFLKRTGKLKIKRKKKNKDIEPMPPPMPPPKPRKYSLPLAVKKKDEDEDIYGGLSDEAAVPPPMPPKPKLMVKLTKPKPQKPNSLPLAVNKKDDEEEIYGGFSDEEVYEELP